MTHYDSIRNNCIFKYPNFYIVIGLELNPAKCELFVSKNTNPAAVEKITRLLPESRFWS
jgi:hypothetical protein